MDYKKAFYTRLEECYLGVKIKSQQSISNTESGFSNLLKIKEKYFSHIKAYLDSVIKNDFNSHDIYNKLFTFFDSYLNDTGTPFFHDTPLYKNIYAKVYTNSKDTSLFYKTKDLYYVKSDTLYTSLTLSDENELYEIHFDASEYIQNTDNTKRKLIFKLDKIEQNETQDDTQENTQGLKHIIYIKVLSQKDLFPELNAVFKENSNELQDEFIKTLKEHKVPINEENLKKLFTGYKKQNEVDFFIHKNARAFLQEQFNLWFYHYLYKDSEFQEWNVNIIAHLQRIKNIAYEVINLIADFEDELKAIWLKPKFVKKINYVFSLDLILKHSVLSDKAQNTAILDSILNDKGFESQIKEWQDLKLIDDSFQAQNISEKILNDERYKFLPLDTKHFSKEVKYKILSLFDDIESMLNGELIKADNFQALNSLMPKYQNKVDLIYIDPPFNTGSDFEYRDRFQDSTWLSLMENRLELAREFLSDRGSIYLHLDHNANYRGRELLNAIFGEENFINEIVWSYQGTGEPKIGFKNKHDYILFFSKNINKLYFDRLEAMEKISEFSKSKYKKEDQNGRYKEIKHSGKVFKQYEKDEMLMRAVWDLPIINAQALERIKKRNLTQKPEALLQRIIKASSKEDSIILDFFAGSGTSIAAAQKLGRKWLGIEMGEHFYNVIIPRIKKVIAGFQSGISKECDYKGGGAFRYYELESYEEALKECEYVLMDLQETSKINEINETKEIYPAKDYQKAQKIIDYKKSRKLIKKLNKGETITLDMNGYRKEFDLFHTLANLQGLKIKKLFLDSKDIETCEFSNGDIVSLEQIDLHTYPKLKNLLWWE